MSLHKITKTQTKSKDNTYARIALKVVASSSSSSSNRTYIPDGDGRVAVRTDAYRRVYLSLYTQVREHMECNGLNAFVNAMQDMAVDRGLLRPEELKDLLALKLRAMHVDGQRVESMLPEDILDAPFLCAIACTYSRTRAQRYIWIMKRVCRKLVRHAPKVELRFFKELLGHFHDELRAAAHLRAINNEKPLR